MFKIGQSIVYPMHGAGVIEDIITKTVANQQLEYYQVKINTGNINLLVPVKSTGVTMRCVCSLNDANKVLCDFSSLLTESDIPWNKRYKSNVDRLKTGALFEVAGVFCDLVYREKTHGLSTSDRKMFVLTKNILCSELACALNTTADKVFEQLLQTV